MLEKPETRGTKLPYVLKLAQNVKLVDDGNTRSQMFTRTSDYGFTNWFLNNVSNKRIKYRQYNRAVFVDIRPLVSAFATGTAHDVKYHMSYFANTILEVVNDVALEFATEYDLNQDQFNELCSMLQTHYQPFISDRNSLSMASVTGYNSGWLANILKNRFDLTARNNPPSVHASDVEDAEDLWTYEPADLNHNHESALTAAVVHSMNPDMWSKVPLGSVGIGLPSLHYVRYMWSRMVEGNTPSPYALSDMLFNAHPDNNGYSTMTERYYYSRGRDGRYYDETVQQWMFKTETLNRRKYQRCAQCRELFNIKFLDWYKIRSYSQNRSRICFHCIPKHCTSYNTHHKAWLIVTNADNMGDARYDYPVEYRHISDTDEPATGSKEYSYVQLEGVGVASEPHDLPVETRRYLTYVKNIDDNLLNSYRFVNDMRRRISIRSYSREMYNDSDYTDVIRTFPVDVRIIDNKPTYRVWIDNLGESRDFAYRYASQRRDAIVEDGWQDTSKNDWNWRPPFYYVDHKDGEWLSTQTEANNRAVMDLASQPGSGSQVDNPDWHRQYGLFLGLELEVIVRDSRKLFNDLGPLQIFERTIQTFHPQGYKDDCADLMPQLLFAKRDGSLPSHTGVEYISQPMSMDAWRQVPSLFWHTVKNVYKAFDVGGVGIHIHIPWSAFTEVQAYAFLEVLTALQRNNNGLLRRIAQRPSNSWTAWDELEYSNVPNTIAAIAQTRRAQNSGKYQGINLMHDNTIELRYFNSNAKGGRVMKNLEFVTMLYDYACHITDDISWDTNDSEVPPEELVDFVDTFRDIKKSTHYADWIQDDVDEECYPLVIEDTLMKYLDRHTDKYPNLHGYLTDSDDGNIELEVEELEAVYPSETPAVENLEDTVQLTRGDY
jgi:hypothetical protein